MVDTIRSLSELQTILADNTSAEISPQDMRDMLISIIPYTENATQAIAAGTTITVSDAKVIVPFTTSGNVTNTAAPFIAAGREGQLVILRNDNGSGTLTLSDTNIGAGGSLLRLTANTVTMAAGSTMALEYSTIQSAWVQLWYTALVAVVPAITTFTVDGQSSALTHEWGDGSTTNDTAPVFVAAYTGVPSAANAWLDGAPANAFSSPYTSLTGAVYYRSSTRNGTRAFVLHATVNGSGLTSSTVTVTYRAPNYYGVSTQTAGLSSAQVVALTHVNDTDPYGSYGFAAAGSTDYCWFGFVDNDATLDTNLFFAIGSERAKFDLKDNPVSVTSTYLKVANYETYRSNLPQLGSVTVVVQSTAPATRRYWGKVGQGTQLSEAQIEALTSDLTASSNGTFSNITSIGAGDYIWLCLPGTISAPTHYGLAQGNVSSGFQEAAFTAAAAQSVTNQYGFVDAAVKNIHSDVTSLQAININGSTTGTWSLKTQAAAFPNRIYMGPSTDTDPIGNANILALDDTAINGVSVVASAIAGSYAVTISGSNYLWFCHPSSISDLATIKDHSTGFGIGGAYRTNVSHTDDFGVTATYRCWRSTNVGIFPTGGTVDIT